MATSYYHELGRKLSDLYAKIEVLHAKAYDLNQEMNNDIVSDEAADEELLGCMENVVRALSSAMDEAAYTVDAASVAEEASADAAYNEFNDYYEQLTNN